MAGPHKSWVSSSPFFLPMENRLKWLAKSKGFNLSVVCFILLTSVLSGLDTYPAILREWGRLFNLVNSVIIGFFVAEILIRIGAEGRRPWRYFLDPWNFFDFIIVGLCLMPCPDHPVVILRLVRVLLVMRLFKIMPQFKMIVQGLIRSISSIGYIVVLLLVHFYMYAVLGVSLFSQLSPERFGNLQTAMISLFQVLTLESWTNIMLPERQAFPVVAPLFFISFIVIGTMVMLNLFVGVIVDAVIEAHNELKKEYETIRRTKSRKETDQSSPAERIQVIENAMDDLKNKLHELRKSIKS